MNAYLTAAARFLREEDAPTSLEYGLLLAGVVLTAGLACQFFGQAFTHFFTDATLIATARS